MEGTHCSSGRNWGWSGRGFSGRSGALSTIYRERLMELGLSNLISQGSHNGEGDTLPLVAANDRSKGNVPRLWFRASEGMLGEKKCFL